MSINLVSLIRYIENKLSAKDNSLINGSFKTSISNKLLIAGWTFSSGFISADMIKDHLFPPSDDDLVVMCGPPPMINFACIPNLDKLEYNPEMRFSY